MFPADELDDILSLVTPLMKVDDPRRPPTPDNLYDYFISRARNHLHVVLCFSPVRNPAVLFLYYFFHALLGETQINLIVFNTTVVQVGERFRSRSLKFPGLISGCTINWFWRWPRDALYAVGEHFMKNFKVICTPEVKQQLIEVMGDIQDDVNDICVEYYDR